MLATDQTVRMRPVGNDAKTVRVRPIDTALNSTRAVKTVKTVPPAISAFDAKTVRHRIVDVAVKPLPSVIADRIPRSVAHRPSKWLAVRVMLVLLLASMPILGISVDVIGLASQSTTSVVVIALAAVLGAIITFAPHRIDMIVGRGLIAGMVACIVYDGARLFGHLIFGLVLGLAFLKAPRGGAHREWPWPSLLESARIKRVRGKSS